MSIKVRNNVFNDLSILCNYLFLLIPIQTETFTLWIHFYLNSNNSDKSLMF